MRRRSVATALVVLSAGVTAAALRRLAARRTARAAAVPAPAPAAAPVAVEPGPDAVVLPFPRPVAVPAPAAPVRCGDTGGVTRTGAPCGARAAAGGRCHHHRVAA
jgi:hypothetical protein